MNILFRRLRHYPSMIELALACHQGHKFCVLKQLLKGLRRLGQVPLFVMQREVMLETARKSGRDQSPNLKLVTRNEILAPCAEQ
jgi:hypothetical protein